MGYIPVAISMVREIAPKERQAGAVAAVSATMGVGGGIGLPLSAWIVQDFSWHGLFWFSAGLAVLVLITTAVVPHVHDSHPAHINVPGIIGLAVGLSSILIGISKGSDWGWGSSRTVGSVVGGVVALLVWAWYQLHHDDPIVDLRTAVQRPVLFTNIAALLIGFGMMAQAIIVPQLLEMRVATGHGLGQTLLQTGLCMAPGVLMMMVFAPVSSHLINGIGAKPTLAIGAVVVGAGYVVATGLMNAPWQLMVASLVASAGANGLMRSVGTTIAGAVMAAILTSRTISLDGQVIPDESAFRICFIVGAGAAFAGALVCLLIPRQRAEQVADLREESGSSQSRV